MAYQFPADVEQLIKQRMALGVCTSEDEVLRDALEHSNSWSSKGSLAGMSETAWRLSKANKAFRGRSTTREFWRACERGWPKKGSSNKCRRSFGRQ